MESALAEVRLELHPDKTRLIEFGRHAAEHRKQRGEGKPGGTQLSGLHPHVWEDPEDRADSSLGARRSRSDSLPQLGELKVELRRRWAPTRRRVREMAEVSSSRLLIMPYPATWI